MTVITYGMGVHWALNAAKKHKGKVEIVDLRTLYPLDTEAIFDSVKKHGKCLVVTEEPVTGFRGAFAHYRVTAWPASIYAAAEWSRRVWAKVGACFPS